MIPSFEPNASLTDQNQCDGCRQHLPISMNTHYKDGKPYMVCTAGRYASNELTPEHRMMYQLIRDQYRSAAQPLINSVLHMHREWNLRQAIEYIFTYAGQIQVCPYCAFWSNPHESCSNSNWCGAATYSKEAPRCGGVSFLART